MNFRRLLFPLACFVLASVPAAARIDLTLDADTLNDLITSMAPDHVKVDLPTGRAINIQMKEMKVTGFDPQDGPNGGILTSVRLLVPELGVDTPVTPKLTLDMKETQGKKTCILRFNKVMLNLPIMGAIDVASLLPPLSLLPDEGWTVDSARGPVHVTPQLLDAKTGAKNIRVGFDLHMQTGAAASTGR